MICLCWLEGEWAEHSGDGRVRRLSSCIPDNSLQNTHDYHLKHYSIKQNRLQLKKGTPLLRATPASWHVAHTGEGAVLTVAECRHTTLQEAMGPDSWVWNKPKRASDPALPLFLSPINCEL